MLPIIWIISSLTAAHTLRGHTAEHKKDGRADVYYVAELLDKFRELVKHKRVLSGHRHELELQRLQSAIAAATVRDDKWALEQAVEGNEEAFLESENAFNEMDNFANTLKQMMGAKGGTMSCDDLTCGPHAYCQAASPIAAECVCEEGYEGDGYLCSMPTTFLAHPLTNTTVQAFDLDLTTFNGSRNLAVVYRDAQKTEQGYLSIGRASPVAVKWTPPVAFSSGAHAYRPVAAGLPSGRIAVAYRDADSQANGLVVGATNAGTKVILGTPVAFARHQSHQMAILPLPENHVVVFYSDKTMDSEGEVTENYGGAALFEVDAKGEMILKGKFRFAEIPVTRIQATLLSANEFVVAFRAIENEVNKEKQEGSVIYGAFHSGEIVLDPHPLFVEPKKTDVWGRDLILVSLNTFAYGYYLGGRQEIKVALIKVDPTTHKMELVDTQVVSKGATPFIKGISLAFAPQEPRTYFFYKSGRNAYANSCAVLAHLTQCKSEIFTGYDVQSVAARSLGESRVVFVFTDEKHAPHYQIVGLGDES